MGIHHFSITAPKKNAPRTSGLFSSERRACAKGNSFSTRRLKASQLTGPAGAWCQGLGGQFRWKMSGFSDGKMKFDKWTP